MVFGFMHSLIFKTCGKTERGRWEGEEKGYGVLDKPENKEQLENGTGFDPSHSSVPKINR